MAALLPCHTPPMLPCKPISESLHLSQFAMHSRLQGADVLHLLHICSSQEVPAPSLLYPAMPLPCSSASPAVLLQEETVAPTDADLDFGMLRTVRESGFLFGDLAAVVAGQKKLRWCPLHQSKLHFNDSCPPAWLDVLLQAGMVPPAVFQLDPGALDT